VVDPSLTWVFFVPTDEIFLTRREKFEKLGNCRLTFSNTDSTLPKQQKMTQPGSIIFDPNLQLAKTTHLKKKPS